MRGTLLQLAVAAHVGVVALLPGSPQKAKKKTKPETPRRQSERKEEQKQ
jgi:hypothetical protein